MNWKLILRLSMFGLAMGILTVFVIPSTIEPLFWLAIFVVCAYTIAKHAPGRPFLHGLLTSIMNSVWITSAHVLLFDAYVARHPQEVTMMESMPVAPRIAMLITGPVIGVISGCVLGLFAIAASRVVRRANPLA
jgi:hypothetical protein